MTSEKIKKKAIELGADLVGVCTANAINEHPPDPRWPQTADKIWRECRSVVAIAKRIPWGSLRQDNELSRTYPPTLVMARLDEIALDLSYYIEAQGGHASPAPQQLTDTALKKGAYGPLSLRHVAVEAGLGTLGLNMMLVTPEFGPRVYLTAVLTDLELECDLPLSKSQCLGPACGRCLLNCPGDAVEHWYLNKKRCSENAQKFGVPSLIGFMSKVISEPFLEKRQLMLTGTDFLNYWQALRSGAQSYAGCLSCWQACPVGKDYPSHLKDKYANLENIPDSRVEKRKNMVLQESSGESKGYFEYSRRWIGKKLQD